MNIIFYLFLFVLGLCWGSFTNVLVDRIQSNKSIKGRSKCDYCKFVLRWFDNIPIFSFLFLKGRCRKCNRKLSWQYPLIEILTGLVFLIVALTLEKTGIFRWGSFDQNGIVSLIYYLGVVYLLWVVLVWDLKYMIIPDFLILIGIFLTSFYGVYQLIILKGNWLSLDNFLISGFLGGMILGLFFGLLYWFSKGKWIGGGDVKLGFWLGLMAGLKMIYFLILIAYTLGALVGIFLLMFKSKKMKSEVPFGPFLVLATFIVVFYKDFILDIWRSLI